MVVAQRIDRFVRVCVREAKCANLSFWTQVQGLGLAAVARIGYFCEKRNHKFNHLNFYLMKKINYFLLLVAALWSTTAVADVVFDETNFPDENFREAIADAYWDDYRIRLNDGDILTDEMLNYELWVDGEDCGIESVQGIEYLVGLFSLQLMMNDIEEIDLSHNPFLRNIDIQQNPLESINISGCTLLESLRIGATSYQEGRLEYLDLSGCGNLKIIHIYNEPLIQLDLSQNTLLEDVDFLGLNEIITLDLGNHKRLKELSCRNCSKIKDIIIYTPDLLYDFGLGIKSIYIDSCPELNNINYNNQPLLEGIGIIHCPKINFINPIGLDVLTGINFSYCNLDSIDISNIPNVEEVSLEGNNLKEIDFSDLHHIGILRLRNNHIKRIIGIENLEPILQELYLDYNSLTSIDISNFSRLYAISICGNKLNAIKAGEALWSFFFYPSTFSSFNNGRQIQVYQTDVNGEKQFFIPLATTASHKGIKDLIEQENNFEEEDTGFDWANVVTESLRVPDALPECKLCYCSVLSGLGRGHNPAW